MFQQELNYAAIGVSGLVHFAIGGLWYSPLLFANQWVKALGFTQEEMEAGKSKMGRTMGVTLVVSLFSSWMLALLLAGSQAATLFDMIRVVLEVWGGFILGPHFLSFLYERKPLVSVAIGIGYHLVALLTVGLILVLWA